MTRAHHIAERFEESSVGPISDPERSSMRPESATRFELRHRDVEPEDWLRFEQSMAEIFAAFGMNLDTPGTEKTPERFLKALYDSTAGYDGDPKLLTAFPSECRSDNECLVSQIIEGPISFYSLCEHHSLPFHGFAHVGYISRDRVIGLSKLTRLVACLRAGSPSRSASGSRSRMPSRS